MFVVLAGVLFVMSAALIKHLGSELPLGVILLWRGVFGLLPFLAVAGVTGVRSLHTTRLRAHVWRGLLGGTGLLLLYYAVTRIPLGDAMALAFTAPLWSAILAVLVLRERMSVRQVAALLVGFAGVLLIVRPTGAFEPAVLAVLGCALLGSVALLTVKGLARSEPASRIAFYAIVVGTCIAAPVAALDWQLPTPRQWLLLVGLGLLTSAIQFTLSRGYGGGTFSRMAPMEYVRLPVALAFDALVFGLVPDAIGVVGALIIIAAASTILLAPGRRV